MKKAIISVRQEVFRELLQIPDDAVIEAMDVDFYQHEVVNIKLSGVGFEVREGCCIRIARLAEVKDGVIDWNLEGE